MEPSRIFSENALLQLLRNDAPHDEAIEYQYWTQFGITKAYIIQNTGTEEDAECKSSN